VSDLLGWTVEARLSARVLRARCGNGPPVALKVSPPGASWSDRARLRREGRLLDRARGPGVVELLHIAESRRRTALVLAFVPLRHPDPDTAAIVERLAGLGIVPPTLTPDHVLMTADGEPVLCGFGSALRYTSRRSRSSSVSRRTTRRASPSFTNTTGGRGTLL
jgi:hypothetical protein